MEVFFEKYLLQTDDLFSKEQKGKNFNGMSSFLAENQSW